MSTIVRRRAAMWAMGGVLAIAPCRAHAQSVVSVSLSSPTSVCAQDITARVTLSAAAAVGTPVRLTSSVPAALTVPASLTIPGGATSGSVVLRCTPTTQAIAVTVTATAGASSQSAILNVLAPALDRITLKANESAARVVTSLTGAAVLAGPAPSGGVIVTLANDQPSFASVPASVTIPAGRESANFTVSNVKAVPQPTVMTITGTGLGVSRAGVVTLAPPAPTALLFEKPHPSGGFPSFVSVDTIPTSSTKFALLRIASPAGASGLVLTVSSSNPSAVSVPSTITVAPGDSTARVQITTGALSQTATAILAASVGSVSKSATVVVSGVTLSALSLSPNRVVGGQPVQGTVSIDRPAPPGGLIVQLASSTVNTLLVPPTVSIAAGARSASFTASTFEVTASSVATVRATVGTTTQSATVSLATEGIVSFTTSVNSVLGGTTVTGQLEAFPGHDGFVVLMSSPTPTVLTVPDRVVFAPGELIKTFRISSNPVKIAQTVAMTARVAASVNAGDISKSATLANRTLSNQPVGNVVALTSVAGVSRTASVSVTPPTLSAITLTPTELVGGSSTVLQGTVTLNGPAPAEFDVVLNSSAPTVGLTVSVIRVAAGATSATFTARTLQVTRRETITVTAQIGNSPVGQRGLSVVLLPR